MRHFLSSADLTRDAALQLFALAADLKQRWKAGRRGTPLAGRTLALIFEKPSLRTRVTFEVGIVQLGGRAVHLSGHEIGLPCQALADFFTLWERGVDLGTMRLAWLGDGNNVCHSVLLLGALLGASLVVACPPGYAPDARVQAAVRKLGGRLEVTEDPRKAATGADVIYTDVWVSMGQEAERERRLEALGRYQVNEAVVGVAKPSALVMHCLPAHRGEEITDAVLDGPRSIVLEQAENRLHAQKAVVLSLLGGSIDDV